MLLEIENKGQEEGKSYLPNLRIKGGYRQQCYRNEKDGRGHYEDTMLINQVTEVKQIKKKFQDHKKKI